LWCVCEDFGLCFVHTYNIMLRSSRFFNYWFFIRMNVLVNRRRRYVFRRPNITLRGITNALLHTYIIITILLLLLLLLFKTLGAHDVGRSVEFHWKTAKTIVCAPHIVRSHYIHVIIRIKFLTQYIIVFIGKIVQPVNQKDNNNKNRMTQSALQQ